MGLRGNTQILDVSNACLGFVNALVLAGSMIESGQIRRAILVAVKMVPLWLTKPLKF